jgi:hypothetical protein
MMKKLLSVFLSIFLVLLCFGLMNELMAQGCSQCRMVPASDLNSGGSNARTLNYGILYLLVIPYLLIMSVGMYVFRKQLNEKWQFFKARYLSSRATGKTATKG